MEKPLPAIPAKRYFTIGEVSDLCGVKPYVLRYWEQEFTQLKPMKRRGNRRYYQHHEVLLVRRIRELLYDQGFTISGARNRLADAGASARQALTLVKPAALRPEAAGGALPEPEALDGGPGDERAAGLDAEEVPDRAFDGVAPAPEAIAEALNLSGARSAWNAPRGGAGAGTAPAGARALAACGADAALVIDAPLQALVGVLSPAALRAELLSIRELLSV
jgi:DNA-binding transcriptional MerR regulator